MSSSAKDTFTVPAEVSDSQMEHDIRGGMAIAKGFIGTLETSCSELTALVEKIIEPLEQSVPRHQLVELRRLEKDCEFCLSRLTQSVDHIAERLSDMSASDNGEDKSCRDVGS